MEPYGLDLRTRIVEAHENGEGSVRELAERFAVAPNTVQNYLTPPWSASRRVHGVIYLDLLGFSAELGDRG